MAEPVSALLLAFAGAVLYGVIGYLKKKQEFDLSKIATTVIAAVLGAGVLLATGQQVTADNVTTLLLGNVGLAAAADEVLKVIRTRLLKR